MVVVETVVAPTVVVVAFVVPELVDVFVPVVELTEAIAAEESKEK
jgi:hypothetical protein